MGMGIRIALLCFFIIVGFQNCGGVSFNKNAASSDVQNPSAVPSVSGITAGQVNQTQAACAAAGVNLKQQNFPVFFDNPINEVGSAPVCAWNQGGNVAIHNGYMTARYTQTRDLNLPANAVICGVDFEFAAQAMKYDDTFFFTFNDYILATNDDYWQKNFLTSQTLPVGNNKSLGISRFEWNRVAGQGNFNQTGFLPGSDYCLGAREGFSQCSWPQTEQSGTISMSVQSNVMTALGLTSANNQIRLSFVTTGDDDEAIDCQHEPLSLQLKVHYILQ